MSSNLINFRQLNGNEKCSNLTHVATAYAGDLFHHIYNAQK